MRLAQQAARQAEPRFAVRIRNAVPPDGLGSQLDQMTAWFDANCGADSWSMTPSGTCGVVNDSLSIYFLDPGLLRGPSSIAGVLAAELRFERRFHL